LIVERKGERIIWRLRAEKAEQQLSGRMQLDAPRLEMFADDGEAVSVVGRRAWFDPLTRGIRFENDVRVRYQQWLLQSEALSYVSETDELRVPGHFEVTGETTRARGKGLRIKRQTQRLWVEDGIWIEEADPERWQQEKR
jgi:lipopolysaccharide export system protein LptC